MNYLKLTSIIVLAVGALAGCGDGFPDEEMHFGLEDKVRPYAVLVEPAEAAPGQTVQVTLLAQAPDPDELDITWSVALDYNLGLYETDEVDRNYRQLAAPLPVVDGDGFLRQTFSWVVPDSAQLYASILPEVITDPTMVFLAEQLVGSTTKTAIDAWLKARTAAEVAGMDELEQAGTWALADRFANQVRFRATLRTGRVIDVTRNLTIRHTARLDGPNTNRNAEVSHFAVVAVEKEDADPDTITDAATPKTSYSFIEQGVRVAADVQIPIHSNWTYYISVDYFPESYTSPFDPTLVLTESGVYRWYYLRQDAPQSLHQLFATDEGEEAEMADLGQVARIMPAGVGATFRVMAAVRDHRDDWVAYQAAPGATVQEGVIEFIGP